MAGGDFLPTREPELVTWITNFNALVGINFLLYGISSTQATGYATLATTYITSYNVAKSDSTRTPAAIRTKDSNRKIIIAQTRVLARIIQAFPGVTDTMRQALGLTIRSNPSPIPPPSDSPVLEVVSVVGRTVTVNLRSVGSDGRAKPSGVDAASIYSFTGATPPDDITAWEYQGGITRTTKVALNFPSTLAAGAQIWLTAQWKNPREMTGPATPPITTNLGGGVSSAEAA